MGFIFPKTPGWTPCICCIFAVRRQFFPMKLFLKAYARRKDKDLRTLVRYAKLFRVEKIFRQYLEVLL